MLEGKWRLILTRTAFERGSRWFQARSHIRLQNAHFEKSRLQGRYVTAS